MKDPYLDFHITQITSATVWREHLCKKTGSREASYRNIIVVPKSHD